jgi:hypothetical protein
MTFDGVMATIHEIDKDHNGYVTKTEMEDILKLKYPDHFENKDLIPIIKKFQSIQNKILIDYKAFRDWCRVAIKEHQTQNNFFEQRSKSLKTQLLKGQYRPQTSIGNSRTQSRLREATKQDYVVNNNNNSYTDLKKPEPKLFRPNSLSSFKGEKITPQKEYSD